MSVRACLTLLMMLLVLPHACGQQVLVDQGRRAAGLWCFPTVADPQQWVYIPSEARFGQDETGGPQFSFLQYVTNSPAEAVAGTTITTAGGGGILHMLVLYETPPEAVAAAQRDLREALKNDELTLRGPVVFSDGRYALVSSIINPDDGKQERRLLATGRAPVLEGNRIALSFDLDPTHASLLLKSMAMANPDISIVFDMTFACLTEAYDADLTIDWSEVRKNQGIKAGINVYYVSADVEVLFDDLRRSNAIRLRSSGSDAAMEALLNTVYDKLLELMFRPVEPEKMPEAQRGGLLDSLGSLIGGGGSSRFGLHVGYQLKDLRTTGQSYLNFNHRSTVDRHASIVFNVGDIYRRYGTDSRYFRAVNLEDSVYQQREIHVGVDGALVKDFDRYINAVTVTLRKVHESGEQTLREVVLDRKACEQPPGQLKMVYGWSQDADRARWLRYEYRTRWSFKGGGAYETDWITTDAPMIDLFAPYELRTVQLVGDTKTLEDSGVRAVVVQIEYPFFDRTRKAQLVVRPGDAIEEKQLEITLPQGVFEYSYTITWRREAGPLTVSGKDSGGVLFVDEIPQG